LEDMLHHSSFLIVSFLYEKTIVFNHTDRILIRRVSDGREQTKE